MKRRRQHGTQQERRIIHGGVGENVFLDDQRARTDRLKADIVQWREGCRSGGDRVPQALRRDITRREILLIVESDDLRPLTR